LRELALLARSSGLSTGVYPTHASAICSTCTPIHICVGNPPLRSLVHAAVVLLSCCKRFGVLGASESFYILMNVWFVASTGSRAQRLQPLGAPCSTCGSRPELSLLPGPPLPPAPLPPAAGGELLGDPRRLLCRRHSR
jgi:hypothetical protein